MGNTQSSTPTTGGDQLPDMFIQDPWYTMIVDGTIVNGMCVKKDVEGRAASLKRYENYIGERLKITGPKGRSVMTTVTDVRHYPTLKEYINAEGWKRIAPHTGSNEKTAEAYAKIMMKDRKNKKKMVGVFSEERVKERGGICAIELALD